MTKTANLVSIDDYKSKLKSFIRLKRTNNVVYGASRLINDVKQSSDFFNTLIVIESSARKLNLEKLKEKISMEDYGLRKRRLFYNLLETIDCLETSDLKYYEETEDQVSMDSNVIVLCKNKAEKLEMKALVAMFGLPQNIDVLVLEKHVQLDNCNLIIFDHHTTPEVLSLEEEEALMEEEGQEENYQHLSLMKAYLSRSNKYLVHYGENCYLVNLYRDRMHAANSKFALYSRIKEMLQFIDLERKKID